MARKKRGDLRLDPGRGGPSCASHKWLILFVLLLCQDLFAVAPSVTTSGGTTSFIEGSPIVIDAGVTVSDTDSTTLSSGKVAITGGYQSAEDVLAFINDGSTMGDVAVASNTGGVLTLTSIGATATTLAEWQAALRAVTYSNSSDAPKTTDRTIAFSVSDGTDLSPEFYQTVSVTAVNDAPVLANIEGTTLSYTENDAATSITSTLTLSDVDNANLAGATVQITGNYASGGDVLGFVTIGSISGSYDSGTGTLTLIGTDTVANYQAALRTVTYSNTSSAPSLRNRTVSFQVDDGSGANNLSNVATRNISVTAVNNAPTVSVPANFTVTEDSTGNLTYTGSPFADVDSPSLTVTLSLADGTITGNTGSGITVGGTATARTFAGTISDLNSYFTTAGKITYQGTANNTENRTLTTEVSDGALSASANSTISFISVNDPPSGTSAAITTDEDISYKFIDADFGFIDPDDAPPNGFRAVKITTLPGNGTLSKNGVAVTVGALVSPTGLGAGTIWTARESNRDWRSVASSADGTKLVAVDYNGYIYTSIDSGQNWIERDDIRSWYSVASSSDGSRLVAVEYNGFIYTSTNSGITWTGQTGSGSHSWRSVTSSADGTHLAAVADRIYTSSDSGVTWTPRDSTRAWQSIASSADGIKLVACAYDDYIYTSVDSGATWTAQATKGLDGSSVPVKGYWNGLASSSDGTRLVAVAEADRIYTSTDSGVTWSARESVRDWFSVASSSDGTRLIAGATGIGFSFGLIYTSSDSGATWTGHESAREWYSVASSSDGNQLVAVDGNNGAIYTSNVVGGLAFAPSPNANGSPYTTFSFQVQDDGGTANGGVDLDPTPKTMTINVTPVNDAPTLSDLSVILPDLLNSPVITLIDGGIPRGVASDGTYIYVNVGGATIRKYQFDGSLISSNNVANLNPENSQLAFSGGYLFSRDSSTIYRISTSDWSSTAVTVDSSHPILSSNGYVSYNIFDTPDGKLGILGTRSGNALTVRFYTISGDGLTLTWDHDDKIYDSYVLDERGVAFDGVFLYRLFAYGNLRTYRLADGDMYSDDGRGTAVLYPIYLGRDQVNGRLLIGSYDSNQLIVVETSDSFSVVEDAVSNVTFSGTPFADADSSSLTVTLSVADGAITANTGTGITVGGTALARTLSGTTSNLNSYFTTPGKISYQPSANNQASRALTITVSDNTLYNSAVVTLVPAAVNDAPSGADTTITINEDSSHTFTSADFGFTDPIDNPANSFWVVKITSLPNAGTLTLGGSTVQENQYVAPGIQPAGSVWIPRESNRAWTSIASSSDGSKLVAVTSQDKIYTSGDFGVSWTARESSREWTSVASSSDGAKLVAAEYTGKIYTSTDFGVNWTARMTDANRNWYSVASSADGTKLVAVVDGGQIYTSTDSGTSWTPRESSRSWVSVASSGDGSKLVAAEYSGKIYTSSDFGVNWTAQMTDLDRNWSGVASSGDGTKLVAVEGGGQIYTSTDSGVNWDARMTDAGRNWYFVASSADGNKLAAAVGRACPTSTDFRRARKTKFS